MRQALQHSLAFTIRFGLILLFFSATRLAFYVLNFEYFPNATCWDFIIGIKFDASSAAMVTLPLFGLSFIPLPFKHKRWYQAFHFALYLIAITACFVLEGIDMEYFKFTLKRSTGDLLDMALLGNDLPNLLPTFLMDFWYVALLGLFLVFGFAGLYRKWVLPIDSRAVPDWKNWQYYASSLILGGVAFGLIVLLFRGGTQLRPMSIMAASTYTSPEKVPLVLNTTFSFIKTVEDTPIQPYNPYAESELRTCFDPVFPPKLALDTSQPNIMLILLESFSRQHVGYFQDGSSNTPFLDSLFGQSLVMTNCYANGKKSIEALPATMAGIPSLMDNPYITSLYIGNKLQGLANILNRQGYHSVFFHGATNGSMDFNSFCFNTGIGQYYGRTEFDDEKHFDGNWGIYDEPFLSYTADRINEMNEPWFSTIFTLSSHHPYSIPADRQGEIPTMENPFLRTIRYTDNSLRRFFSKISKEPWFENTVFVLTADHTSFPFNPPKNEGFYFKNFRVPLALYSPKNKFQGEFHGICQQTDIMPTVLDITGNQEPFLAFGQSLLANDRVDYAVGYNSSLYILFTGDSVTFMQQDGALHHQIAAEHAHPISAHNSPPCNDLKFLRSIVQQYNTRMINNLLSVEN